MDVTTDKVGVLLVGFGGPRCLDEVAPMLARIMGDTPPPAVLAAAQKKYAAIGGASPLVPIAHNLCQQLQDALQKSTLAESVQCVQAGMCFTDPSIAEGLAALATAGCSRVIYLSLTPFESWAAWAFPAQQVRAEAARVGIDEVVVAPTFGLTDAYLSAYTQRTDAALDEGCQVIFVAHSLPLTGKHETADHYRAQFMQAGTKIAQHLGLPDNRFSFAYTSTSGRGGLWLAPTLTECLDQLAATGAKRALVCPLGFATDHMEVLYDIDHSAAGHAHSLGLDFLRTPTLASEQSIDPLLVAALMDCIQKAACHD
ncbi:MAG: ferrochelatase [Coriobacteriia bacterium]|nr:ferrochelatase [Coriobacteriia bacterium]